MRTREVNEALHRVRDFLRAGNFAAIEARLLASPERKLDVPLASAPGELRSGTKPIVIALDEEGRTYVVKRCPPALCAAEEAVWRMRELGRRPAVPAREAVVMLDGEEVRGLIKPYIDVHAKPELTIDTAQWTPLQRAVMLLEHAWDHFLGNLDTNTSQYAVLGPDDLPVNIDADRAFAVDDITFSRFLKYKPVLPNARTFLYADYVEGRIEDLPFHLLQREARRIHMLNGDDVRAVLRAYADTRFADPDDAEAFIERTMERRRSLEVDVARFVRDLHLERDRLTRQPRTWTERTERASARAWDQWQVMLQVAGRGAPGRAARRILRLVRGRSFSV